MNFNNINVIARLLGQRNNLSDRREEVRTHPETERVTTQIDSRAGLPRGGSDNAPPAQNPSTGEMTFWPLDDEGPEFAELTREDQERITQPNEPAVD